MKSNEKKVRKWAKVFGLRINKTPVVPEDLNLAVSLVKEEVQELLNAVENKDLTGIADGVCDSIWVIIRLAQECGLPVDELFEEVYRSNMTKVIEKNKIDTEQIIEHSIKNLIESGKANNVKVSKKGKYLILRNAETNKILKPVTFSEPDLTKIINKYR